MKLTPSGSQTVGPFFRIGLEHLCATETKPDENPEMITVYGKVLDGDGIPVPDAVLQMIIQHQAGPLMPRSPLAPHLYSAVP